MQMFVGRQPLGHRAEEVDAQRPLILGHVEVVQPVPARAALCWPASSSAVAPARLADSASRVVSDTPRVKVILPRLAGAPHGIGPIDRQPRVLGRLTISARMSTRSPSQRSIAACSVTLQRRRQLRTVRREHELLQAAAELGPVDALAGIREQQLFEHVPDVIIVIRARRAAARVEVERDSRCSYEPSPSPVSRR